MLTTNEMKFLERAIELAGTGVKEGKGGPFGCVIVHNNEIVGEGSNEVTSSNDPTAHAEVVAIRNACAKLGTYQLNDCVIYTSCEPCPMCLGAIYWARPSKIYYANTKEDAAAIEFDDHFIYSEMELPVEKRKLPTFQLLRDEALEAFERWKKSTVKIRY